MNLVTTESETKDLLLNDLFLCQLFSSVCSSSSAEARKLGRMKPFHFFHKEKSFVQNRFGCDGPLFHSQLIQINLSSILKQSTLGITTKQRRIDSEIAWDMHRLFSNYVAIDIDFQICVISLYNVGTEDMSQVHSLCYSFFLHADKLKRQRNESVHSRIDSLFSH